MAKLEELVDAISDAGLKAQLKEEIANLKDKTNFGLIFERHLPETVVVGDIDPLNVGDHVRPKRAAHLNEDYRIIGFNGKQARLLSLKTGKEQDVATAELLAIKRFGDPAYVGLEPLGSVRRSETRPSHVVINGENFHSLQALVLAGEKQIDCIYIDPPYNTGAKDWTYNNHFVDNNDTYRHSKWLSMMEKRLRLAKKLLKPDGVLICTIDENELHHLGVLLEELFPAARRQLVSICINPSGASGEGLSRVEEYAFFCFLGDLEPTRTLDDMLIAKSDPEGEGAGVDEDLTWESLLRRGNAWYRARRKNLCYPVLLNAEGTAIVRAGEPLEEEDESKRPLEIDGHPAAWPVRKDGRLGIWRVDGARLNWLASRGYAYVSGRDDKRDTWALKYLMSGMVDAIDAGTVEITGKGERGQVIGRVETSRGKTAKTMWYRGRHNAGGSGGTQLVSAQLGKKDLFSFPKSVYAVRDCLKVAIGNRKDAVILDFFAGSGTTLNATCLLNAEDDGNRRSILVTNNEVNPELAKKLNKAGHYRGDPEFEKHGVFEAVTRPRCEAAIRGTCADGSIIQGSYLDGRPYGDGFDENVDFSRLDYLDVEKIELGQMLDSIHPLLWLAAGARGAIPKVMKGAPYLIAASSGYAVLLKDGAFREFEDALAEQEDITHVFLITDSDEAYAEMREHLGPDRVTMQLYRDFLRHFRRRARL